LTTPYLVLSVPVWGWVQSSPTLSSDTSQERQFGSFRRTIQVGGPSVLVVVMAVLILYHSGPELLRSLPREMMSRLGSVRQFGTTGPKTLFGGVPTVQPFWACSRGEVSGEAFGSHLRRLLVLVPWCVAASVVLLLGTKSSRVHVFSADLGLSGVSSGA